jgi:hypothetical protein
VTDIQQLFAGFSQGSYEDIDVVFRNVRFGQSPSYTDSDGNMPITMIVDMERDGEEPIEDQIFSIGKGFEVEDGGESVTHSSAKIAGQEGFSKSSKGDALLTSLVSQAPEKTMAHFESVGVGPRHAAFWEGLSGHIVREEKTLKGMAKPIEYTVFSEVFGWEGEMEGEKPAEKPAKKAPAKKAAAKKAAATKPERPQRPVKAADVDAAVETVVEAVTSESFTSLDLDVEAKLIEAIRAAEDYDAFLDWAYAELEEIVDEAVQTVVDDETGLYSTIKALG